MILKLHYPRWLKLKSPKKYVALKKRKQKKKKKRSRRYGFNNDKNKQIKAEKLDIHA